MDEGILTFTHQIWLNNKQHLFMHVLYVRLWERRQHYPNSLMHYLCWIRAQCIPHIFPNCICKEGWRVSEVHRVRTTKPLEKKRQRRDGAGWRERLHAVCAMLNIAGLNYVHAPKNKVLQRNAIPRNTAFETLNSVHVLLTSFKIQKVH